MPKPPTCPKASDKNPIHEATELAKKEVSLLLREKNIGEMNLFQVRRMCGEKHIITAHHEDTCEWCAEIIRRYECLDEGGPPGTRLLTDAQIRARLGPELRKAEEMFKETIANATSGEAVLTKRDAFTYAATSVSLTYDACARALAGLGTDDPSPLKEEK